MAQDRFYLDYNASAPLLPEARVAMIAALELTGNPSSVHAEGRAVRRIVEEARRNVAALANARPDAVFFTSGSTEAAATLLTPHWTMGRSPLTVSRLYISAAEHPCLSNGGRFAREWTTVIGVRPDGLVDLDALEAALKGHDAARGMPLVATHLVNNETGVVQPAGEIHRIAKAAGAVTVIDAAQAWGRIPVDLASGCGDFLIISAHKIGGPKGVGAVVCAADVLMPMPLIGGGGQERGHRAGTENTAAIAGFGAAAVAALGNLAHMDRVAAMRDRFEHAVRAAAPDTIFHGMDAPRVANTSFFSLPGMKAETAQIAFDLAGVALSAGSACSSGKIGPSHVLKAMGVADGEGALRVSLGSDTGERELAAFAAALEAIVRRRSPAARARAAA